MKKLKWQKFNLHILICVNKRPKELIKPSCGNNGNFTKENFKELKKWILEKNLKKKVKLTRTHCLGICPNDGFITLIYPKQEYYHLNDLNELKDLIINEID